MVKNFKAIKNRFFEIISLSGPKSRIFIFLSVLLGLFLVPLSFLENLPNFSLCSRMLGSYCYSAGITRGVSSLLKGDLNLAIDYNFLSIPVLIIIILIIISDIIKIKK